MCPRCAGQFVLENGEPTCLQCGYVRYPPIPPEILEAVGAREGNKRGPRDPMRWNKETRRFTK